MKNNKLSIEKFRILKMSNLSKIKGGTGGHDDSANMPTYGEHSETTTFTTDKDEPCPTDTEDTGTVDNTNTFDTIPTLG